jgi:hypothetical protein
VAEAVSVAEDSAAVEGAGDLEVSAVDRSAVAARVVVGNFTPSRAYLRKDLEWKLSLLNL